MKFAETLTGCPIATGSLAVIGPTDGAAMLSVPGFNHTRPTFELARIDSLSEVAYVEYNSCPGGTVRCYQFRLQPRCMFVFESTGFAIITASVSYSSRRKPRGTMTSHPFVDLIVSTCPAFGQRW